MKEEPLNRTAPLLVVATHNEDKLNEIREILRDLPFRICSQGDLNIHTDVEESGASFSANALLKARAVQRLCPGAYVIGDDSGLCVDALGGAPGLFSSRFAGAESSYPEKFRELWRLLADTDPADWSARFICAMAVVRPDGSAFVSLGTMEGRIIDRPRGDHGFGYDPIFFLEDAGCTSAELLPEEKNARSHRARALQKTAARLRSESD